MRTVVELTTIYVMLGGLDPLGAALVGVSHNLGETDLALFEPTLG